MISEKWLDKRNDGSGDWHDDQGWIDGFDPDIVRSKGSPYGWVGYQFGSAHPAGMHALLVDGTVRIVSFTIDQTVFNNLGDCQDGNPAKLD